MIGHNTLLFIYIELKSLIKQLDIRWRDTDVQSSKKQKGTFQRKKRIDSTPSLSSPPINAPKWTVDEHFLSTQVHLQTHHLQALLLIPYYRLINQRYHILTSLSP